ncbi:hypothetical protein HK097_002500 [Rhizophlyctis rosea]|uniref:Uncharacterized protein n=1 Tax=Rhizophlyctis rosea TaxID=64517 RepID=A0AAD5X7V2_9FUNG|nr:hypothetical protein HK097_002500 [Rhizophlyctis rosea]
MHKDGPFHSLADDHDEMHFERKSLIPPISELAKGEQSIQIGSLEFHLGTAATSRRSSPLSDKAQKRLEERIARNAELRKLINDAVAQETERVVREFGSPERARWQRVRVDRDRA